MENALGFQISSILVLTCDSSEKGFEAQAWDITQALASIFPRRIIENRV